MPARRPSKAHIGGLLAWLALTLAGAVVIGSLNFARIRADFEADARTLHRIVSQRADQHDAHLTSLAAVLASPDRSFTILRAVAEAVQRFYPRITAIDVLAVSPLPEVTFTTRELGPHRRDPAEIAAFARDLPPGQATIASNGGGEAYDLVKRLPDGNPQAGLLVMTIDGRRLTEPEGGLLPGTRLSLEDPSGRDIVSMGEPAAPGGTIPAFSFEKTLGSRSQPLLLTVARRPSLGEFLPPPTLVLVIAGAALCTLLGAFALRERRTAREARARAQFHEHEARLAHAMRVNTVGEMASGIAHELTQPLTAILSRSQAGLRLARSSSIPAEVIGVLEDNARLAKRAGDILGRLRAYVSNKGPSAEPTSINTLVRNVREFVQADLDRHGVSLNLNLSADEPASLVDRVSLEQVVQNLLRNAAEAVTPLPKGQRTLTITTTREVDRALIVVRDQGPGIPPDSLPRLFEPFFTTKDGGMGLGLPLCERLVEAFGGEIIAANDPQGGAVFTVRLPLLSQDRREAAE